MDLLALRRTFQPGGLCPTLPRPLIIGQIYPFVRHPINAGVLAMVLGMALAVQSFFVMALFIIYFIQVLMVLSMEEKQLFEVFGDAYRAYSRKVKRLVPFVY